MFTETNSPDQNRWAGNELLQSFDTFLAFNVEHIKQEETVVANCFWRYHRDANLLRLVMEISGPIAPDLNRHFLY